ncbi:hypothetical protein WCLP8_3340001 [uncultured Gammaproteobacteria bacterium]
MVDPQDIDYVAYARGYLSRTLSGSDASKIPETIHGAELVQSSGSTRCVCHPSNATLGDGFEQCFATGG